MAHLTGTAFIVLENGETLPVIKVAEGGINSLIDLGSFSINDVVRAGAINLLPYKEGQIITGIICIRDSGTALSDDFFGQGELQLLTPNISAGNTNGWNWQNNGWGVFSPNSGLQLVSSQSQQDPFNDVGPLFISPIPSDQTYFSSLPPATWEANTFYEKSRLLIDSNGKLQRVDTPGVSGASEPSWASNTGGHTQDGDGSYPVTWECRGTAIYTESEVDPKFHLKAMVFDGDASPPIRPFSLRWDTQPTTVVAGESMDPVPQLTLLDQYGNPFIQNNATLYQPAVAVYSADEDGPGNSGNYLGDDLPVDTTTGLVQFSDVVIPDTGTYRLKAHICYNLDSLPVLTEPFTVTAP